MGGYSGSSCGIRLLGLGNDLLADDAFGLRVAEEAARRFGAAVDVRCSSAAGLHLLDDVLGAARLVVADTLACERPHPGVMHVFRAGPSQCAGGSPHCTGLFDVLATARRLGLPAPEDVTVIAVEPADCTTLGGAMDREVERCVARAVEIVAGMLGGCHE